MGLIIGLGASRSGGGSPTPGPTPSGWTGHADAKGLRELGWRDSDIEYYQAHGVNWNKEDDKYHLVSDYDKYIYQRIINEVLGGDPNKVLNVVTFGKIKEIITDVQYCPWFDTSNLENMDSAFRACYSLISLPLLDTSKVTAFGQMFMYCYSLSAIPAFDYSKTKSLTNTFYNCYSISWIPPIDTRNITSLGGTFYECRSLRISPIYNTENVTNMQSTFNGCYSLNTIPSIDTSNVDQQGYMLNSCYALANVDFGLGSKQSLSTRVLTGKSVISLIAKSNNASAFSQSLFLNYPAAKYVYEYSISSKRESWMTANDGSMSAQQWLAAVAAQTNKPNSSYAITLSFTSGSSDYTGA